MNKEILKEIFVRTDFPDNDKYIEEGTTIVKLSPEDKKFKTSIQTYLQDKNIIKFNEEPLFVFYELTYKKGSFFSAERTIHKMLIFLADRFLIYVHEDTEGWAKQHDAVASVYYHDIVKIEDINDESTGGGLMLYTKNNSIDFIYTDGSRSIQSVGTVLEDFLYNNMTPALTDSNGYIARKKLKVFFKLLDEQLQIISLDRNKLRNQFKKEIVLALNSENFQEAQAILEQFEDLSKESLYKYYELKVQIYSNNLVEAGHMMSVLLKESKDLQDKTWVSKLKKLKGLLLEKQNKPYEALIEFNESLAYADKASKDEVSNQKHISNLYNQYLEMFTEIPYQDRKVIFVSNNEKKYKTDNFTVLDINELPEIKFPPHHPVKDELYIGHPYNNTSYVSIQNYDYELLTDRINEYCYLLQCLGAESITIENVNGEESYNSSNIEKDLQIDADRLKVGVDFSGHLQKANSDIEISSLRIAKKQIFNPVKSPYVPQDLIWFPHEVGWQRLVNQRMQGNLLEYNEVISSKQNQVLNSNELYSLQTDVQAFVAGAKSNVNQRIQNEIKNNTITEWKVNVKFRPFNEMEISDENVFLEQDNVNNLVFENDGEREFLEEINFMLEDGELAEKEFRILERHRIRLGLSEEVAKSILDKLTVKFSSEELEFIDEIKLILELGELTERDKSVFIRLGKRIGIEEDRCLEIINLTAKHF